MVVENVFRRLKDWWRCRLKRIDMQVDNATTAVGASVVLHKICELIGDNCLESGNKIIRMKMMLCWCNMVAALDKLHQPYVMLLRTT